jgi:hypothetical protein
MAYYHLGYHLQQQLPPCPPAGAQPRWVNATWFSQPGYCFVNDTSDALGTAFRRPGGGVTAPFPFKGNGTYVYSHWSAPPPAPRPSAALLAWWRRPLPIAA